MNDFARKNEVRKEYDLSERKLKTLPPLKVKSVPQGLCSSTVLRVKPLQPLEGGNSASSQISSKLF